MELAEGLLRWCGETIVMLSKRAGRVWGQKALARTSCCRRSRVNIRECMRGNSGSGLLS